MRPMAIHNDRSRKSRLCSISGNCVAFALSRFVIELSTCIETHLKNRQRDSFGSKFKDRFLFGFVCVLVQLSFHTNTQMLDHKTIWYYRQVLIWCGRSIIAHSASIFMRHLAKNGINTQHMQQYNLRAFVFIDFLFFSGNNVLCAVVLGLYAVRILFNAFIYEAGGLQNKKILRAFENI